jgi:GGDEF domain-containing protein
VAITQPKTLAGTSGQESLLPVLISLIQGMAIHAIKGDPEHYRQFRDKMLQAAELNGDGESVSEIAAKAEMAANLLNRHCTRANEYFASQISELRAVIDLFVDTMADLAVAKPEYTRQLREIARLIHAADHGTALRQQKLDLSQCLSEIRQAAELGFHPDPGLAGRDPVTDLNGRPAAETALVEACSSKSPVCAVVLLLDRIKLYNRRYGREVGDKTLRFFADYVKRSFACEGSLFRWTGPALLMLRHGVVDKVQPEVRRVLESRLQYDCETESRHLLLSIDATSWVLPMMVDPRMLVNKIDSVVGG